MNLISCIESVLFACGRRIRFKEIAQILECDQKIIRNAVSKLSEEYLDKDRGVRIIATNDFVELATAPKNLDIVKKIAECDSRAISQSKIETLAVLAYQGPLLKTELEQIRGVNCSLILKNLKIEELVDETDDQGAVRYIVSTKFLRILGVGSVIELPEYSKLNINAQCSQN